MSKKEEFFKERFKQALDSTFKVISEELDNLSKKKNQKDFEDYKISNLYSREDYIKFRALTDSNALKKRFSDKDIFKKNFPKNENVENLVFLYSNFHNINKHFIDGSFEEGLVQIPEIEAKLQIFKSRVDPHHKMIFYYKFASLEFGVGNNKKCIAYLDKIISNKELSMREDLLCFARVLNLVAHYEAGLDYHLETLLRSTYKFLIKMNDLHEVQKEMIKFIRGLQDIYPHDLKKAFKNLHQTLKIYENHPHERRAFLYLDIISWLESKMYNKTVGQVIRGKYLLFNSK